MKETGRPAGPGARGSGGRGGEAAASAGGTQRPWGPGPGCGAAFFTLCLSPSFPAPLPPDRPLDVAQGAPGL